MKTNLKKIAQAYEILKVYNGNNQYIKRLKRDIEEPLSDFSIDYVIFNHDKEQVPYNKIVKISEWYGEKLKEDLGLEFIPEKLYINSIIGETPNVYHMLITYRQSQEKPIEKFIPKSAIITPIVQDDFHDLNIDFDRYDRMGGITLKEHQKNAIKFLVSRKKGIVSLDMGMGKEIDVNTILPTPNGFKHADDISIGDCLFSSYGKPTKVLGKFYQGEKDLYEITFNDGTKANCGLEHLWIAKRDTRKKWEVITLSDIMKSGLHPKSNPNKNVWKIPICQMVEYSEKRLVLPPYQLGNILSNDNEDQNWDNRKIPEQYLCGSIRQRGELLCGIIDNNGKITDNGYVIYETKSKTLAMDLKTLVLSLAGTAEIKENDDTYAVWLKVIFNPFADEEKAKLYDKVAIKAKPYSRYITDIKYSRTNNAVCFKVDSEDESFLTENYVVTHNTMCSIVAAIEGKYNKILVICPASLKTNWKKEIERFVPQDEITIVEGSKWKENKYTIINYDILKNFYIVPKENRKFKTKVYTDDGNVEFKTIEKVVKTEKKSIVEESLDNSQLFQSKFDLIIIDEAHRLSNKDSGMYEIVSDLIKRSNPDGIFELTGTMVKNNPINLYNILKLIDAEVTRDWISYVTKYCDGRQIFRDRKERDYFTNKYLQAVNKASWYDLSIDEKKKLDEYLDKNCKKIWLTNGASNLDELRERISHLYYRETAEESLKQINVERKIIEYELKDSEQWQYSNAWDDFLSTHEEKDLDVLIQNHKLIEGSVFRQLLADFMVERTIKLTEEEIKKGNKVVIFCCFDNELYTLKKHFDDRCVIYNGKMLPKKKDQALNHFKTDDECKVFIGNIAAASVGLNINEANVVIFNNVDFVPANNVQAEYRILRLGQTKDCHIYYQKFKNTYMDRLFEILDIKNEIINAVITDESHK